LLLTEQDLGFTGGMQAIFNELGTKLESGTYTSLFRFLKDNDNIIRGKNFVLKALPYYYDEHVRLGSFGHMQTSYIHKMERYGLFSVHFCIIGEGVYRKRRKRISDAQFVSDAVNATPPQL
jgi:hypothetical protein